MGFCGPQRDYPTSYATSATLCRKLTPPNRLETFLDEDGALNDPRYTVAFWSASAGFLVLWVWVSSLDASGNTQANITTQYIYNMIYRIIILSLLTKKYVCVKYFSFLAYSVSPCPFFKFDLWLMWFSENNLLDCEHLIWYYSLL